MLSYVLQKTVVHNYIDGTTVETVGRVHADTDWTAAAMVGGERVIVSVQIGQNDGP